MNLGPLIAEEKETHPDRTRRAATEPKIAFAGLAPEASFARFRPSMGVFSEGRAPSHPFGCWGLGLLSWLERKVDTRKRRVAKAEEEPEPQRG